MQIWMISIAFVDTVHRGPLWQFSLSLRHNDTVDSNYAVFVTRHLNKLFFSLWGPKKRRGVKNYQKVVEKK